MSDKMSHLPPVTERNATLLTLISAVLKGDNVLPRLQLLLGEFSYVLVGFFGAYGEFTVVGRLPSERLQADDHRVKVLLLPQVDGLEGLLRRDAQLLRSLEECVYILHALEGHGRLIDLLDGPGLDGVHKLAEQSAVPEDFVEVL